MTMPRTLTLIRHGESESNLAKRAAERGEPFPPEQEKQLMNVHTSERRLTPKGVKQAQQAGVWMRKFLASEAGVPVRGYVSPYVRAAETASLMNLGIQWRIDSRICERNWGKLDQMTHDERMKMFKKELGRREEFALFWKPPGGDSLMNVFLMLRDLDLTLEKKCSNMNVVMVCHGETMLSGRFLREYWLPRDLRNAMQSNDQHFKTMNCRIIQYTRDDEQGNTRDFYVRVRFVDPRDPTNPDTNHDWMPVERRLWSDDDLLEYVNLHPRFLQTSR